METMISGILASMISLSAPLLIAAEGEVFVERSGQFNMGIEGIMISSALCSFATTIWTNSLFLGFVAGGILGALLGAAMFLLIYKFNLSPLLVAIVLNLLATGVTGFLATLYANSGSVPVKSLQLENVAIPLLSKIPYIGEVLFCQNIVVYISYIMVPLASYYLFHTKAGLEIRAVGEDDLAAQAMGIDVFRIQLKCFVIGGITAGISGAYTSLSLGMFLDNMTQNKGFISMALCAFSGQKPVGTMIASLFFALVDSIQIRLQVYSSKIPYEFMLILPYILTIVALAITAKRQHRWKKKKAKKLEVVVEQTEDYVI